MTSDVGTCQAHETLERAAQIMWERDCGCVPIVDEQSRPVSIITDRDICMAAWTQGKGLAAITIASAMSRRMFTTRPTDGVADAERSMRRGGVRRLPVVNDAGVLVGVLSLDDILRRGEPGPVLSRDPLAPATLASTASAVGHPRQ